MQKRFLVGSLAACAVIVLSGSAALGAENWIGTWKLDVAKSKFSPGPTPKSMTITFAAAPDGIKFSSDGVDAEGNATHTEYVSKFDGKEVPYTGNPNADTASPKKINANSYDNPWKKDGKPTMSSHAVVSKDGKTFTVHQTGKNAKGEAVDTTVVFIKQ